MSAHTDTLSQGIYSKPTNRKAAPTQSFKRKGWSYRALQYGCRVGLLLFCASAFLAAATVTVSPTSLSFGKQVVGAPSAAENVILTNGKTTAITITSIATDLSDYAETNNCPVSPETLGAEASCTISVTFTPAVVGSRKGTISVIDSAGTKNVSLSGTGIVAATATPASLSFGNHVVGVKSAAKTVTVTNKQTTQLTITGITTNLSDYTTTTTCPVSPSTLTAGASCKVSVFFTPGTVGSRVDTLTVSTDSNTSSTVSLSGTGVVAVATSPSSLSFVSQALGTTSAAQTVTLTNNQSTALKIASVTSNLADFALTNACPLSPSTLKAGASCTVSVTFSPKATGTRTGTLSFNDNANGSPQTVSLTGTGAPAALVSIAVTPTSASIAKGTTQQFTAMGTYTDSTSQNLTNSVTWTSSATATAAVASGGLATGAGVGTATITAASGTISGSATLTVTAAALVSISVTPANPSFALGTTQQLAATGTYTDGSTLNLTSSVSWGTGNPSVATVNAQGLATSVTVGSTSVTATSGSIVGSTTLYVTPATLVSIAVTPALPTITLGMTQQFTATGTYSDGSTQNITDTILWSSDTPTVATISNNAGSQGLATSVGAGAATISATSSSISGSTILTVSGSILSRVPLRVCLTENETSTSSACTLSSSIPVGDGVVVFVTSTLAQTLATNALQDTQGNTYSLLASPVNGGYGSVYMAYSQPTTALNPGDAITLTVPGSDSWGLSIYDIGPVQTNPSDVGVTFQNPDANDGLPGFSNTATGVPGW